ncbi:MAG: zf-HC2 domain-containing protein, partial [Oscillospiraceae bacterium]|nr:zf-HC2 domain-containing protein [Oscillospiraceae bacterium]
MKYCDDYAALLDLFVDGELSPAEMADVQAHLDGCPGCRAYVDDALALRAAFPDAEDTEVPAGFAEGVMAAVRAQDAPEQPQSAPQKRKLAQILLSLAACCAIVLLVRGVG